MPPSFRRPWSGSRAGRATVPLNPVVLCWDPDRRAKAFGTVPP